ncbi:MAG: galactose mutarotase [Chitinophagaceae bacterium]|nr:galactose mutarotase [Chitinophagaceae bacterium]MBP6215020.1 galactose mutarotase [Chitinophagaceae bacterium]HQV60504.1 aldose epimerase family protein [Chitinophagaceae bacterium]HQV85046.1 aldose epimerase family protein [Chitinophagaceae bacterium]HQX71485.1 aldose epimerase family protein [Chitinophagaceae bacterium]
MPINQQFCFSHSSGQEVSLFTLSNSKGTKVLITNLGATITSFKLKNADGSVNDIVLGFEKIEDYAGADYLAQYPWFGCAVGRVANRIKNAEFMIDDKNYSVSRNNGNNQLHGGLEGFDKKVWQKKAMGDSPDCFLELKYVSPDGEEGYPSNLEVIIRFELNDNDELSYQYTATCDKTTIVNLTHHGYFNLNNGEGDIKDHEVKIYGSLTLDQDEELVANGSLTPVENTLFNFSDFVRVGERLTKIAEYDKSYIANKKKEETSLSLMAEVKSAASKLLLQVYSTEPIVHFYTGKWIPTVKGKNGTSYGAFSGLCLETHKHPNAINIPHFPTTILRPGETYSTRTIYKVIQV